MNLYRYVTCHGLSPLGRFVSIFIFALMPIGIKSQDTQPLLPNLNAEKGQSEIARCDIDSLGDLWVFTLDKTGSMLSEISVTGSRKNWTSTQITEDVTKKLAKEGGILDQINYSYDRIAIMETGYGVKESDSFGKGFCSAPPLDSSFIHVIQTPQRYNTNRKNGLKKVLSEQLLGVYNYRESFVSQIRVLGLHRLIKWVLLHNSSQNFRQIHIVTITDDADENDQWKMDYYTIKRDPTKMEQLNALHSKYVYSPFTRKGGGYLSECEKFTDITSKNHIYMYNYVTLQQNTSEIKCYEDSIIRLVPMDGKKMLFELNLNNLYSDSICFVYIDTVSINSIDYPICQYMNNQLCIEQAYDMNFISNDIVIRGKVQVQYYDSIYGGHFKSYPFLQYNRDYTSGVHATLKAIVGLLAIAAFLLLVYVLWILPNRKILTICVSDGRMMNVRRGYRWQWETVTPLTYSDGKGVVFAKHNCFKKSIFTIESNTKLMTKNRNCIIIDSPVPLIFPGNVLSDTSKNNIQRNAGDTYGKYPESLLHLNRKTCSGRISSLQNNRFRWVRLKLYPVINRIIFHLSPHYYYWGNRMEGLLPMPRLRNHLFLLEQKSGRASRDDAWLNTYYQGNFPLADVLICLCRQDSHAEWDVYQLRDRNLSDPGIGNIVHLIHYHQERIKIDEIPAILKILKKAILREMGTSRVIFLDHFNNDFDIDIVHFNVADASCMAYVCLVDDTEEEKCQILYSPLMDTNRIEKNIVINTSQYSRLLWTSLVPFKSKSDRPSSDVARIESLDIVREGVSCQKMLSLKNKTIEFDNIRV